MKLSLYLFAALLITGCKQKVSDLTIATAANVQPAMQEITDLFSSETGITCHITAGASGNLTTQISQGAPFDLFVSADTGYPLKLHDQGLTDGTPRVYAYGSLVLWTIHDKTPAIKDLTSPSIHHIAIANPNTAPYGLAAREVLKYFGLYDSVKGKLVYGQSISQTNQFILSGAADDGFTSLSTVLSDELKSTGHWSTIESAAYAPIAQAAVVLKGGQAPDKVKQQFLDFLVSKEASSIFVKFGYTTQPPQ